jgi:uncharacterized RDD family membrane protein YckC
MTADEPDAPPVEQLPGTWRRFFARLIDRWIVWIALIAIVWLFRVFVHTHTSSFIRLVVTGLLLGILTFAYFVVLEVTRGTTLAKKLFGLQVHGPDGAARPSLAQSAIRNAFELLWAVPYMFGGWLILVAWIVIAWTIDRSPTAQGIHDRWAGGTRVVAT